MCQYIATFINTNYFTVGVVQISELSPSFLEFCLGNLIVPLALCHLFFLDFFHMREGEISHISSCNLLVRRLSFLKQMVLASVLHRVYNCPQ